MVKLETMREEARRLQPAYEAAKAAGEPENPAGLRALLEAAQEAQRAALHAEADREIRLGLATAAEGKRAALLERIAGLRAEIAVAREAAVIFGKGGAQRKVAEGALGEIEAVANERLRECGIDLSVGVRWSREGQGLARACEACGEAFPASARAKVCARCGAGRGQQVINRLELELSDRSGAAEDLVGVAVQLAASAWLRRGRGSTWGVALMDEPFSACDRHNRKALAGHLGAMVRGCEFEQALVISHAPDASDLFPGRIEVLVKSDGAREVRVI
jgi:hypothetical protein